MHTNTQTSPQTTLASPTPCESQLAAPKPHEGGLSLQPTAPHQPPAVIDTKPLPLAVQSHKARRKGRIACLPKLQRDMVNHMLSNGVPYKNIVAALRDADFTVTERNISNWATGGYLEWRFQQDLVLQNRLDQDDLLDRLRRDDASELPEVGLQAAATRLSQILVQKTSSAEEVEANLPSFSQMVDVLCRLNREISLLQKDRDQSRRTLGRAHDAARIKEQDESSALDAERFYSDPPADSGLDKPAVPPLLPPVPTADHLANADREEELTRQSHFMDTYLAFLRPSNRTTSPSTPPAQKPAPKPQQNGAPPLTAPHDGKSDTADRSQPKEQTAKPPGKVQ